MTTNVRVASCCLLTWTCLACASERIPDSAPGTSAPAQAASAGTAAAPPAAQGGGPTAQAPATTPAQQQPAGQAPGMAMQPASGSTPPAGQSNAPPAVDPSQPATPPMNADPMLPAVIDHTKDLRGTCSIKTNFPDDRACIAAPKPEEGYQIHVGPSNYDDPAEVAKFIIKPGEEKTECYTFRTLNEQMLTFQTAVLSGRSGTHHIINTTYSGDLPTGTFEQNCGGSGMGNQWDQNAPKAIGSLPGASKAYMPRGMVAPEYADVGRTIPPKVLVASDMHYYNFTDKDILREYWINVYFPPTGQQIKRMAVDIATFGGGSWNNTPIQPGTDMVYKYECPITGNGFITNLLGHYHSHGKRFGISIKRKSGTIDKVFEMYDYGDPAIFDYNSVTMNPPFSDSAAGATSGILAVSDGDTFQWECHIVNDSDKELRYTNEVKTGEMCNAWGFSVGIDPIQCSQG